MSRTDDERRRTASRRRGTTRLASSAGLVVGVVLAAAALTMPAQAHHKPDHAAAGKPSPSPEESTSPSPSPSPEASPPPTSEPQAYQLDRVQGNRVVSVICPQALCPGHYLRVSGYVRYPDGTFAGNVKVSVETGPVVTSYAETTTASSCGGYGCTGQFFVWFWDVAAVTTGHTWTVRVHGDDSYAGSNASGVFTPRFCCRLPAA